MRNKSAILVSLLSIIATTGVVHTSDTFADQGQRAAVSERIGHGGSTYSFYTRNGATDCQFTRDKVSRLNVIERIGHGGSIYSLTQLTSNEAGDCNAKNQRVSAEERIGHGGSTYSPVETMMN